MTFAAQRPAQIDGSAQEIAWKQLLALRADAWDPRAHVPTRLAVLFARGGDPSALPAGPHRGVFLTPAVAGGLDMVLRAALAVSRPWLGKLFHGARGSNLVTPFFRLVSRVMWPGYRMERDGAGRYRGFEFAMALAPAASGRIGTVVRIDYAACNNPRLLVRDMVDEMVELAPGIYLGRALLRRAGGSFRLLGYFALRSAT